MYSLRAPVWDTDVYINGHEKYAANEILTAYLNKAEEILRIPGGENLKSLLKNLMVEADMSYDRIRY